MFPIDAAVPEEPKLLVGGVSMCAVRIFSVDPGRTIGFALMEPPLRLLESGQTTNEAEVHERILQSHPTEVVLEKYRPYPGMGRAYGFGTMEAVEVAERIKMLCYREGIPVVEQASAQIGERGLFTPMLLRQLGLWQPGKPHANDAIRHALYRLWFGYGYSQHKDVADRMREMLEEVVGIAGNQGTG